MTLNRYAKRLDANDGELAGLARKLGAHLWRLDEPCDYLMLWRKRFDAVEIKVSRGTLTPKQKLFHAEVLEAGGRVLVWRCEADVLTTLGAR